MRGVLDSRFVRPALREDDTSQGPQRGGRDAPVAVLASSPGDFAPVVGTEPETERSNLWKWFLLLEAVFALIYFPFGFPPGPGKIMGALPWMEWPGQVPAWALLGFSSVVAIAYGTRRYKPRAHLAWRFVLLGVFLFILGDTCYKSLHQLAGVNVPFPSFIDAIYITMYPVLAIGLLLLVRSRVRGGDRTSLIDALIVTLGMGLVSWIFLIGPNVRASGGPLVRLTAAAYPLGDVLLLAMITHLWSSGGLRNVAGRLLAIGAIGTLVSDSIYGLVNLHPAWNWNDGNPIDLGWIIFYACWGAAALHPSMAELSEPAPAAAPRTSNARLALLATVSLIAPVVLIAESLRGHAVDAPVIAAVAILMFLLVLGRMSGLVGVHREAVARERVLRRVASELVAASGRTGLYQATIAAVSELVASHTDVLDVSLAVRGEQDVLRTVARSGGGECGEPVELREYPPEVAANLLLGQSVACPVDTRDGDKEYVLFLPLLENGLKALVSVRSASELQVEIGGTLETIASQVRLALDREELTEAFHVRRSESRFQTLVQHLSDVILITRPDTTITYQTPSAGRILGYELGVLEGTRLTSLIHPDDVDKALARYGGVSFGAEMGGVASWRMRHRDGTWRDMEVVANNLLADPTVEGIVLTMRDVSERKSLEEELKHQAFHDSLSGLANRALFRDRLEHALARAARSSEPLAVLFCDLDDFKLVNDSLGHAAGDELLVAVAQRISRSLRSGDTAARFGGDEFAILLEEASTCEAACEVAEKVLRDLKAPLLVGEREVQVHASIGIAFHTGGPEDPAELLQAADVAMYAAKASGKNRYEVYHPELQVAISERLEKTALLQRAVDEQQFILHYQPIVDLESATLTGVEALVRWLQPERGLVPPLDFIPLAEETGLIVPIGRWVLLEACAQAARWQRELSPGRTLKISVNISANHFQHDALVEDVASALEESGLDPSSLVLEITESLLVHEVESVIARMLELKRLGITFAVDDFGTGYSSLSYLKRFPIDILKVDKSFVDDVGDATKDATLANAIVQLGKSLNLDTVAEGIEEPRQAAGLRALGCRYGQGFLFARPLTVAQLDEMLPQMTGEGLALSNEVTVAT